MLNMIAIVEQVCGMCVIKFFWPLCINHKQKINVSPNDSATMLKPKKNPEIIVVIINANIVLDGEDKIQLIADEYQFCFWGVVCLRDLSECNKYPGTHNAEKPNGMLSIIFHAGTFNARIRRNLRYIFEIRTPIKYM